MNDRAPDHGLQFLLAFNGRIHHLEKGYWLKFEITCGAATPERPHGLSYSFTLHAPDGMRLIGFDNAHNVPTRGGRFKRRGRATRSLASTREGPGQTVRVQGRRNLD